MAQYNSNLAIGAIENADEVRAVMQLQHIRVFSRVYDMLLVQPADGLPHVPSVMTNITMDQALDSVAASFKGVVLYGACADIYTIGFEGGVYYSNGVARPN
jgi:hypothetical protein